MANTLMNVELPAYLVAKLDKAVEGGTYDSQSDAVRDAIERWEPGPAIPAEDETEYWRQIVAVGGEEPSDEDPEVMFDRLDTHVRSLVEAAKARA